MQDMFVLSPPSTKEVSLQLINMKQQQAQSKILKYIIFIFICGYCPTVAKDITGIWRKFLKSSTHKLVHRASFPFPCNQDIYAGLVITDNLAIANLYHKKI